MTDVIHHVERILSGEQPDPKTLLWLRRAFERHLSGESLSAALGINAECPKGLRDHLLRSRWRAKLGEAIRMLDGNEITCWSAAALLSAEFARQARSHRAPSNRFEQIIHDCRQIYSAPSTTVDSLWREVRRHRVN